MRLRDITWISGVLLVIGLLGYMVLWDVQSPLRPLLNALFCLGLTGLAWLRILRFDDPLLYAAFSVPLSLALLVMVSNLLLYLGVYSEQIAFVILSLLTCLALSIEWQTADHPAFQPASAQPADFSNI